MLYTDDDPRMLKEVAPMGERDGPIFISNHSKYGFNIRHFYWDWKAEEFKSSRKGVRITPTSVEPLLHALVDFVNEADIIPGRRFELIEMPQEEFDEG